MTIEEMKQKVANDLTGLGYTNALVTIILPFDQFRHLPDCRVNYDGRMSKAVLCKENIYLIFESEEKFKEEKTIVQL